MIDKAQNAINKGAQARMRLDDPLFKEAVNEIRAEYIAQWASTNPKDAEFREKLWTAYNLVGKVCDHLITVMNNGKLAQAQIDQIKKAA